MLYALRKLIAFVFLGGMSWFVYQDLDNLDKPWFMHALGLITIAFAFFWLLIPMVVVWCRIRRRCAQNKARYQKWLEEGGLTNLHPRPAKGTRLLAAEPDEQVLSHEKGTLYVEAADSTRRLQTGRDSVVPACLSSNMAMRPVGRPSDVAFPGYRRKFYVCQRTHCYVTNRRIVFKGKDLDIAIPFGELKGVSMAPGGIVFEGPGATVLFTFQNPLIAVDVLMFARKGMVEKVGHSSVCCRERPCSEAPLGKARQVP